MILSEEQSLVCVVMHTRLLRHEPGAIDQCKPMGVGVLTMRGSLCGWTQDRGHDNGAAQIADRPEPLHQCVAGQGPLNAPLSLKRA